MGDGYRIVYADPPWQYRDRCNDGERGASHKYPVLSVRDLARLEVPEIAARDALLYLWATYPMRREAMDLIEAWGFRYTTVAFVWVKRTLAGDRPALGMGHYTRACCEEVLLARRGRGVPVLDHGVSSVVETRGRGKHSEKPIEVRERIERLHGFERFDGDGRIERIELFARGDGGPGWNVWGNEATGPRRVLELRAPRTKTAAGTAA